MAELAQLGGQLEQSVLLHERAGEIARKTSNRPLEALAALNLAYGLAELAEFDRVAEHSFEAAVMARSLGDQPLEVLALASFAFARLAQGQLDEAFETTTRAITLPAGDYGLLVARLCHAAVLAVRGSFAEAISCKNDCQ